MSNLTLLQLIVTLMNGWRNDLDIIGSEYIKNENNCMTCLIMVAQHLIHH